MTTYGSALGVSPLWICDVCGGEFDENEEEPHMPHEAECDGGLACTCDYWVCEPCCWECQ